MEKQTVYVITGASSGIGKAVALGLSQLQKNVVLIARREDLLAEVQKKCLELGAPKAFILPLDLAEFNVSNIQDFFNSNKIVASHLINSAGLAKGTEHVQNAQPHDWDTMIDVNIKGLLKMTHYFLPSIIKNRGHIVNLGSVAGRLVYEGGAVYCATKFAVRAFSEGLRMDLKGTGVRVTNIEPGMVNTEFSLVRLGNQQKADAVYAHMTPLSADDVAQTILWCLNQPTHVNIQELVIYPTDQASVGQVYRNNA